VIFDLDPGGARLAVGKVYTLVNDISKVQSACPVQIAEAMKGAVYELHDTLGYIFRFDKSATPLL
jgi:hypothetical protein